MLESIVIALTVAAATCYAAWSLTPAVMRNRIALRLARTLGGPEQPGLRGRAASLLHGVAKAPAGGCNDCPANMLTPAERAQRNPPRN